MKRSPEEFEIVYDYPQLGKGSFGAVRLVRDKSNSQLYAMKIVHPSTKILDEQEGHLWILLHWESEARDKDPKETKSPKYHLTLPLLRRQRSSLPDLRVCWTWLFVPVPQKEEQTKWEWSTTLLLVNMLGDWISPLTKYHPQGFEGMINH